MIGRGATTSDTPDTVGWLPTRYAKGVTGGLVIRPRVSGLCHVDDTFTTLDDWVTVYGALSVTGGATSDVTAPKYFSAARHKTQMLTDDHKALVTVNDGTILNGESRLLICADDQLSSYYGISIETGSIYSARRDFLSIIRGLSQATVDTYGRTQINLNQGDLLEVWYHRRDSTVRAYQNGILLIEQFFPPTDIPHGPGRRWVGIVPGCDNLRRPGKPRLNNGIRFATFEAFDVLDEPPVIHDAVDTLTVNPGWTTLSTTFDYPTYGSNTRLRIYRHPFLPLCMGCDHTRNTAVGAVWNTPLNTDSMRVAFEIVRIGNGKFTLLVRGTSDLSSGIGVQWDLADNTVSACKSVGISYGLPDIQIVNATTRTDRIGVNTWQYNLTYNDTTKTLKLYKGGSRSPLITWVAGSNFTPAGRYVGMKFQTAFGSPGVELTGIDAYDAGITAPLPGS